MTPERWQQVKQIFQSAIERPASERDGFISQACADDQDLRNQVQSLISSYDEAGDTFQTVAVNLAAQMMFDEQAKSLLGQDRSAHLADDDRMRMETTPGTIISHYRILSKIGAGGMGEVYLAQDTKLDRRVALKILPAEVAANQERMRRFIQEAKSASALNHPNIKNLESVAESMIQWMNGRAPESYSAFSSMARGL